MPRSAPRRMRRNEKPERVTDADVNAAVAIIQRDYYQDVHDLGDSIKEEVKSGDIDNEDTFLERIREDVDSSGRVIYTFQAKLGMLVTGNEDAWEELGDSSLTVEQKMYCALEADVLEYLGDFSDLTDADDDEE